MLGGTVAAQEAALPSVTPSVSFQQVREDTSAGIRTATELKEAMAIAGSVELSGLHQWERQKSAKVAVISSMVLPGLGQAYNGRQWKAAIFLGLFTFYAGNAWVEHQTSEHFLTARDTFPPGSFLWNAADEFYQFHKANATDYLWWSGAVWFIGMLDAFVDAHLFDIRAVDPVIFEGSRGQKYIGVSSGL
jgi:hypothetical protein